MEYPIRFSIRKTITTIFFFLIENIDIVHLKPISNYAMNNFKVRKYTIREKKNSEHMRNKTFYISDQFWL